MTRDGSSSVTRRQFLVSSGLTGALALAGCTQEGDSGNGGTDSTDDSLSGAIDISGSSTVFPLATAMTQRFAEDHSGVRPNVSPTGTGGGFANSFCAGDTDFNNASRPIREPEREQCSGNDIEPVELRVATDALTVVVNNDADWIDCITTEELAQIWSGEDSPSTWQEVNSEWPDRELELYGPSDASGTYDYFIESILGEGGSHRQDYSPTEQDRTIIQGVEGSENALGYLGFAYYSQNSDRVKALGVDDGDGCVEPSLETARSGEYTPLARPLFTYAKKSALTEDQIAEFARFWLENSTSQEIVANEVGYVPLSDSDQSEQMDALETAIDEARS